jgi:hypothetical protein
MINFVLETSFANLVQALELIEVNGVAVRHDEPMKDHSQARLPEALDPLRLSHDFCAGRDEQALSVVRVDAIGHHANDRTAEVTVQSRDERSFKNRPFKDQVVFAARLIEIRIAPLLRRLFRIGGQLRCLRQAIGRGSWGRARHLKG